MGFAEAQGGLRRFRIELAALASGFSPRMMECFPASGHAPSLPACLEKVAEAEVMVVLVAHRWFPRHSPSGTAGSTQR